MSDTVVGCTLERVSNPEEVRAFAWTPCDGQPDCSALVPADFLGTFGTETTYYVSGQARETDLGTAVALCFGQSPDYVVLIAREDGWLIDAFRILESGENDCFAGNASLGRSRFGFVVNSGTAPPPRLGGILAPLDRSEDPVACEVTPTPSMVGPQLWQWLGDERWVWEFYPSSLYSVSSYDGSGFYRIGGYTDDGPIYDMNYPSGPGDIFYFKLIYLDQNGYRGVIGQSNGVEPPTGYLEPEPGAFLSNPAYADSHIAWLRGTGQTDVTHFGAIELWASVYSPDPAELQPYKVGDVDANVMLWMQGALGHVALPANVPGQATVWRLEDGQKTAVTMPGGRRLQQLGVTAGSLWAVGFPETGIDDMIARFSF